jgi:hypothetical protein
MNNMASKPFDTLEDSYQYVCLLGESVKEAREAIDGELARSADESMHTQVRVLQIVAYKLTQLDHHLHTARRLLKDLRTLERLLLGERDQAPKMHSQTGTEE